MVNVSGVLHRGLRSLRISCVPGAVLIRAAATVLGVAVVFGGCASLNIPGLGNDYGPLAVVDGFSVSRYLGKWYEIARYPNSFENNCYGVTAEYLLLENLQVRVVNTCHEGALDGPTRTTAGIADVVAPAKLKVTFFPPFAADYWVIDLGDDYEYAVVGEPSRQFFWILSRTPELDADVLDTIRGRMAEWGYDRDRLLYTPQNTTTG